MAQDSYKQGVGERRKMRRSTGGRMPCNGGPSPSCGIKPRPGYGCPVCVPGYHHKMQVSRFISLVVVVVVAAAALVCGAPQGDKATPEESESPAPYEYEYKVEDAKTELYFGKEEKGTDAGRVEGKYYVWLPDKRLMTVTYYVDGESGFVPTITFEDNANPIGGARRR